MLLSQNYRELLDFGRVRLSYFVIESGVVAQELCLPRLKNDVDETS